MKLLMRNEEEKKGDETQASHTNYCNKQIYIKAALRKKAPETSIWSDSELMSHYS